MIIIIMLIQRGLRNPLVIGCQGLSKYNNLATVRYRGCYQAASNPALLHLAPLCNTKGPRWKFQQRKLQSLCLPAVDFPLSSTPAGGNVS